MIDVGPNTNRATIVVVDRDTASRAALERTLGSLQYDVAAVSSTREALAFVRNRSDVTVIIVDLQTGDVAGIDVVAALRDGFTGDIIATGAGLTLQSGIAAMKAGACDVIEKPINVARLVDAVRHSIGWPSDRGETHRPPGAHRLFQPRSVVERWIGYVIVAYDNAAVADGDLKTLEEWARLVAASYSTLSETCRLVGIKPLDARDFVRVFRAIRVAARHRGPVELFLNVSDRRTLRALSIRAGVDLELPATPNMVAEFWEHQRFIAHENQALAALKRYVDGECDGATRRRGRG